MIKELQKFVELMGKNIDKAERDGDEKLLAKLKTKIIGFLIDLEKDGVIVEYDRIDGKGQITKEGMERLNIGKVYQKYLVNTIKEIEKEVDRREEERKEQEKEWMKKNGLHE